MRPKNLILLYCISTVNDLLFDNLRFKYFTCVNRY
nr:MAG TPA: short tail fiber protein [Caudoviricetes sp.]